MNAAPEVTDVLLNTSLQAHKNVFMNVAILWELLQHVALRHFIQELHDNFGLALKPKRNVYLHNSKVFQVHQQALLLSCKAWHLFSGIHNAGCRSVCRGGVQPDVKQARRVVTALNFNRTLTVGWDYMAVVDTRPK